jgi:DNA helicase-2/ATP-dependent DNA helicase PcrA
MQFIADLHIHSYLSRATARNLNLEHLNAWAQLKGITVIGTGDFTHPQWFSELSQKLESAEDGLFGLKPEHAAQTAHMIPASCRGPVRFILSGEISSIYKKDGKTRKVHNVVLAPTREVADKINQRLGRVGNIASDGRPILGLDCRRLLEIVLETSEDAFLIPAHIWTPWFSVLGSKSGFDSIEECFEDLTSHIFAAETGLSSDPAMNWRVSSLDGLTLVSNSDAHSPANLGREANLFDTELSYFAIRDALRSGHPDRFLGTLEYFAEEGKYHYDGHRKCGVRFSPLETMRQDGLCPVCGRPVTVGVMHRVEELATREMGEKPQGAHPYTSLLPLTDILSEIFQVGPKSKKVNQAYRTLLERLGPEFQILRKAPIKALDRHGPPLLGEAVKRMRNNQVHIAPGYDGEFGTVSLFEEEERSHLLGQKTLFGVSPIRKPKDPGKTRQPLLPVSPTASPSPDRAVRQQVYLKENLNEAQQAAVQHTGGPLLIVAGPGTGKTFTLAHRIARLLLKGVARPNQILAVTFTNKAAQAMTERLSKILGDAGLPEGLTIRTFHALCLDIISVEAEALGIKSRISLLNEKDRLQLVKEAIRGIRYSALNTKIDAERISDLISKVKQRLLLPEDDLAEIVPTVLMDPFPLIYKRYQDILNKNHLLDFDDLILKTVRLFETEQAIQNKYRERFRFIFVDEYQDINYAQYRLVRLLAPADHDICVIGDPDQAIYGFRGADVRHFHRFCKEYPRAKTIRLTQNYRSTETILRASGQLIGSDDPKRTQESMWSGIHGAKALVVAGLPTEKAEAEYIVKTIDQEVGGIAHFSMDSGRIDQFEGKKDRTFADFVVLYRIKEQGRAMEAAFSRSGIPFQMLGNEKLEDRKGIRELVSYLKAGCSVACDLDVERILNFPARGIGRDTVRALRKWSEIKGCSLMTVLGRVDEVSLVKPGPRIKLRAFSEDLHQLKEHLNGMTVFEQVVYVLNHFALVDAMDGNKAFEEGLSTFLDLSRSFGDRTVEFLAHLALERAQDRYDHTAEKVSLMTMHAAKGLEFPVVFIAGCEDGLIPYRRTNAEEGDPVEERRLFYVALTRAQEKIYVTHTKKRLLFGQKILQRVSPFLRAVEEDLKEYKKPFPAKSGHKKEDAQLTLFEL